MRFAIYSLFAILFFTLPNPAQELPLYPDYWFSYTTLELNRPVSAESAAHEAYPSALPYPDGSTLVLWLHEGIGYCYQIINRYGNLVLPDERQPLQPDIPTIEASNAQLISDGSGGAYVAWRIGNFIPEAGTYVQRLDSLGNRMWGDSAVKITDWHSIFMGASTDGMGGLLVAIGDCPDNAIRAYRLDGDGNPIWGDNGVVVCGNPYQQDLPSITHDGNGGAYVTWRDYRPPYTIPYGSIWMQRLDSLGNQVWVPDGLLVLDETPLFNQMFPDGEGGFLLHWGGGFNPVCRIGPDGRRLWVIWNVSRGSTAKMVPGESGYFYIGFGDEDWNVRAQRIDIEGNTYWPGPGSLEGAMMSLSSLSYLATSDFSFRDSSFYGVYKLGNPGGGDDEWMFAQKMDLDGNCLWGEEGAALSHYYGYPFYWIFSFGCAPDDKGGVVGVCQVSYYGLSNDIYSKHCLSNGTLGGPKPVKIEPVNRPKISSLPGKQLRLEIPQSGQITLDLFGLLGRKIGTVREGYFNAGTHAVSFDDRGLASGVYFIRLKTDYGQAVGKVVVVR